MDRNTRLNFQQRKKELEMERLRVGAIQNEIEKDEILYKKYGKTRDELTEDQVWEATRQILGYDRENPKGAKEKARWFVDIVIPLLALPTILLGAAAAVQSMIDLMAEDNLIGEVSLIALVFLVFTKIQQKKKSV